MASSNPLAFSSLFFFLLFSILYPLFSILFSLVFLSLDYGATQGCHLPWFREEEAVLSYEYDRYIPTYDMYVGTVCLLILLTIAAASVPDPDKYWAYWLSFQREDKR